MNTTAYPGNLASPSQRNTAANMTDARSPAARGVHTWNGKDERRLVSGRRVGVLQFHVVWPVLDAPFHDLARRVFDGSIADAGSIDQVATTILAWKPGDRAVEHIVNTLRTGTPGNWLLAAVTDHNEVHKTTLWIEFSNTVEISDAEVATARNFLSRLPKSPVRTSAEALIAGRFNNDPAVVHILANWPAA